MRDSSQRSKRAWATYAKAAREGAYVSMSELARQLRISRITIYRWEMGQQRPENAETVARFARAVGVELEGALAAAGLRPGVAPPSEPTRVVDEEVELILRAPVDARLKKIMVDRLIERREREKRQRMDDVRFWLTQHSRGPQG